MALKFGLFAINHGSCGDPRTAVRVARHAEAAGFESLWSGEHLVLADPAPDGFPIAPTLPLLDTVVGLTLVAAHTSTVRIASGIIVLPLRNPVVLAKELASLDQVADGRLIVGIGPGYVPAEFDAVGVALSERAARTDDYIRAMRALWSMPEPAYKGRYVSFSGVNAYPRPVLQPGPPIVVGAGGRLAARRAITLANGWYGFGFDVERTRQHLRNLRAAAGEYERPPELGTLEITVTPVGPLNRRVIEQYRELGVDRLVLLPQPDAGHGDRHTPVPVDRILRNIDHVAQHYAGSGD
ncbi:TIGR03619 family F420-dependent LLM class oxidoreductase [Nocardia sp. NPDC088792]|uniref:TIGR03619 family F420-dependent LLM class oxidoreductase n=1 Tax=Nocardia sp. NPDC088792 TaxID=3364332 RepID=UPI0037F59E48